MRIEGSDTSKERNKYNEGDVVLLTNWISKLSLRNHTSKERNKPSMNWEAWY